jgi:Flp pilus assembly pilin Flp
MSIRVVPESVRSYGTSATEQFGTIRTQLDNLCTEMVGVEYYGPNAVAFKTECGRIAAAFATTLMTDLTSMCDAVNTSTSNIAQSLGGVRVEVSFDGTPIDPPAVPAGDTSVGVNLPALEAMTGTVNGCFEAINTQFDDHLSALQATDWTGNAKDTAVGAISNFTRSAKGKCAEAQSELNSFIADQVEASRLADQ